MGKRKKKAGSGNIRGAALAMDFDLIADNLNLDYDLPEFPPLDIPQFTFDILPFDNLDIFDLPPLELLPEPDIQARRFDLDIKFDRFNCDF